MCAAPLGLNCLVLILVTTNAALVCQQITIRCSVIKPVHKIVNKVYKSPRSLVTYSSIFADLSRDVRELIEIRVHQSLKKGGQRAPHIYVSA